MALDRPDALGAQGQPGTVTGGRGAEGNGLRGHGGDGAFPGQEGLATQEGFAARVPDPGIAASEETPAAGANGNPVSEEPEAQEPGPSQPGGEGEQEQAGARPRSVLGWVLFPFAAVWHFLFPKKPRPFIVELPLLGVFARFLAFLM